MAQKITVDSELRVHIGHNVVDDTIMPPSVSICVECNFAVVKDVVCCLSPFAKFAQVGA